MQTLCTMSDPLSELSQGRLFMGNVILNPKTVDPLRLLQCYPQASGQRGVVLQVTFYQSPGACEAISGCCNVNKAS